MSRPFLLPILRDARWRTTLIGLTLTVLVAAAFQNSVRVPFLLDDEANILENESLARLPDLRSVLWPRTDVFTAARPGGWTLVAVGTCFAGMQVKEVMVTAPVIVFLFDATLVAGT